MDKTKLSFAVDASQIDIKPLLQKEFLEISMRAISSANPNRNNSWFTRESMEKSKASFYNKPILGYFENGDFVSHNGEWESDPETQMDYWDTLSGKGERILGVIRSEDDVEIKEDQNGLSWICLTCILWTQYSYKQVKRLLKDAKRAKETGGTTKNISVEVDITDYEMLPNGVMKINEFNLVGITILGSRNGIKVEPGIEDAELSVVDVMGKEFFEKQKNALRLAYEKLDNSKQKTEKESETQMDVEEKDLTTSFEESCPVCHQEPCVCEEQKEEIEQEEIQEESKEELEQKEEEQVEETEKCEETCEEEKCEETSENSENLELEEAEKCEKEEDDDEDEETDEEEEDHLDCETKEEQPVEEPVQEEQVKNEEVQSEEEHFEEEQTESTEEEVVVEERNYEEEIAQLTQSYQELEAKYNEALSRIKGYEKADFLREVSNVLDSVESLSEDQRKDFMVQCEKDEITSIDDLKVKVALAATFTTTSSQLTSGTIQIEKTEVYSAPVISPVIDIFGSKAEKTTKENKWDKLQEFTGKN